MCRYPNQPRAMRTTTFTPVEENSTGTNSESAFDLWDPEELLSGLTKRPDINNMDTMDTMDQTGFDWIYENPQLQGSSPSSDMSSDMSSDASETFVPSGMVSNFVTPGNTNGYFDWPFSSSNGAPCNFGAPLITPSTEAFLIGAVPLTAPVATNISSSEITCKAEPLSTDAPTPAATKRETYKAPRTATAAPVATRPSKRPHSAVDVPRVSAHKKLCLSDLEDDMYETIKAKMPVIDYATMTPNEIQIAKRERNRLAAEKYRLKGRHLIEKLQTQNDKLMQENEELRAFVRTMSTEMQALRELVTRQQS